MNAMIEVAGVGQRTPVPEERLHGPNALDLALANWVSAREPEHAPTLEALVMILSMRVRDGHTALDLARLQQNESRTELAELEIPLPTAEGISDVLRRSRLIGSPQDLTPLVVDGDLLFFRRFFDGELRISEAIRRRLTSPILDLDPRSIRPLFRRLFDLDNDREVNWQAVAAAAALRSRFLCIAGGPGTGKTTTVTRIMALLMQADSTCRIRLAAPTGKAANRMAESIRQQLESLDLDADVRQRVPTTSETLHRLLRYRPSRATFAYNENRKLEADVVIVDEASMIDHDLFTALLAALDDETRLILLGDPDQLPSVDAGNVFGELCTWGAGTSKSPELLGFLEAIGLRELPPVETSQSVASDAVVTLKRGYRFGPASGIGHLAAALREGRPDDALRVLTSGEYDDLRLAPREDQRAIVRRSVRDMALALTSASLPGEALNALSRLRVLSPLRVGPSGIEALNEELESWLSEEGIHGRLGLYQGKPILITRNDYDVSLFNGDVGILWNRDNRFVGCFPDGDGIREIPYSRLPSHELAWAMTIHKSQGSEFDDVVLILPEENEAEHLTRELLYTAVTRARRSVTIIGEADVFAKAAGRREDRITGLMQRLP